MKITTKTTISEIEKMLTEDGFGALAKQAKQIKKAAISGALLWTPARITTTDNSRIDARPIR